MFFVSICCSGILFVLLALPLALRRKRKNLYRPHLLSHSEDIMQSAGAEPPLPLPLIPNDETEYEVMVYRWRVNPDKYPYPMPPPHTSEEQCD
jgi:hypothetical protein